MKKLMAIPGIGPGRRSTFAMRGHGMACAFPHTDYGVKRPLRPTRPAEILALAEAWQPWRAYATVNLWNLLVDGYGV